MSTVTLSVKERVLQQLQKLIESMSEDANNGVYFEHVQRSELEEHQRSQGMCCAILDTVETFVYQTVYLQCTMQVGLDVSVRMRLGDVPSTRQAQVLAEIKKTLLSNYILVEENTFAQLTENIQLREYLPDPSSANDDVITAFVTFDVIYREHKENPYQLM